MISKKLLPASLLLAALAAPAAARQKTVEFRQGDALSGPIQSARLEQTTFRRVNGALVEGPRRLTSVSTYAPDGKRKEQVSYAPDGSPRAKYVHLYDDAGNEVEMSFFDGRGDLQMRRVYRPAAGETLTYNGDGSLRDRRVVVTRPDNTQLETRLYDGAGVLVERSVNERDAKKSVWSTYRGDGTLKKRDTHSLDYGGPHHTESETFAADGVTPVGRRVSDADAAATDLRAVNEGHNPGPRRTRETREYDSHRNLSKQTTFRWNEATGEFEPAAVTYYTITYYR
ncbi:MAG TPA: hypothetical protein VF659_10165 [Pyrinomonadaceae bacterium]|jgi:hypothetical protein